MSTVGSLLPLLKERRPLVHCITNPVTMSFVASALTALSVRAIMANSTNEVEEVAENAGALLINTGVPQSIALYRSAAMKA